ncbi:hypothetical protein C8R43DRAFT_1239862 [Mycena crocata]|nr:hypothetical protein C8R43DRAFT_1239862 [Mycena crocata]
MGTFEIKNEVTSGQKLDALTYPVLDLPYDVTAEIYLCCVPPIWTQNGHWGPFAENAPLLLLGICRAWRDVALATPQLWTSSGRGFSRKLFRDWIGRTGAFPLSLVLHPYRPPNLSELEAFSKLPDLEALKLQYDEIEQIDQEIIELSSRWCDVDLIYNYNDLLRPEFQSALCGRLPALERLKLQHRQVHGNHSHFSSSYWDDEVLFPVTVFQNAPKLRDVTVVNLPPTIVLLPWTQLTRLDAEDFSLSDCLYVLRKAPLLVHCVFRHIVDGRRDIPEEPFRPVPPLIRLESFALHGGYGYGSDNLFELLTLPALQKLHSIPYNPDTFVEFLTRSTPTMLHDVSVHCRDCNSLIAGLPLIPALSKLEINRLSIGRISRILRCLCDFPAFMPNLESLQIRLVTPKDLSWQTPEPALHLLDRETELDYAALVDALRARWRPSNFAGDACLMRFSLIWLPPDRSSEYLGEDDIGMRPGEDTNILERLSDLVDDGMNVYLGTENRSWLRCTLCNP